MQSKKVISILLKHLTEIQKHKVKAIYLFGSVAKNKARAKSDIDLLVEFTEPVGLFTFIRLKNYLEKILKKRVDLVTKEALKPQLKEQILKDSIRAA